jgi:Tfp pilus assembly ATPase PilU
MNNEYLEKLSHYVNDFCIKYEFSTGACDRKAMFNEEVLEYVNAKEKGDTIEMMDGLVDMMYIALGTCFIQNGFNKVNYVAVPEINSVINEFNHSQFTLEQFSNCFKEIHENNMKKSFVSQDDVFYTMAKLDITDFRVNVIGSEFNVYNAETGKLIKRLDHPKPNLAQYLC